MPTKQYNYPLIGLQQVQANLNKAIEGIKGQTKAGLLEAGLLVQRRSQEKSPFDTGNLHGSHNTEAFDTAAGPVVVVSVGALYSVFVHENLSASHPVGEAKFLEKAVHESIPDIPTIIASRARVA